MVDHSVSRTAAKEAALFSSLTLLNPSAKVSSMRPQVTPPSPASPATPGLQSRGNPQTRRNTSTPTTPRAPRKRPCPIDDRPKYWRLISPTPTAKPTRASRGARRRKILTFDRITCIPMHVIRAQKDDTSALLRPLPRRSDKLKVLVKIRIDREMEKLGDVSRGILDAAFWVPRKPKL